MLTLAPVGGSKARKVGKCSPLANVGLVPAGAYLKTMPGASSTTKGDHKPFVRVAFSPQRDRSRDSGGRDVPPVVGRSCGELSSGASGDACRATDCLELRVRRLREQTWRDDQEPVSLGAGCSDFNEQPSSYFTTPISTRRFFAQASSFEAGSAGISAPKLTV